MKNIFLFLLLSITGQSFLCAQDMSTEKLKKDISSLIDKYSEAREKRDTALLKTILIDDVDQLVSTGKWRNGIRAAVEGMIRSSANSPGTRTLTIDKIKILNQAIAIVDCKYDIQNTDGSPRRMWSSFIVVIETGVWKISAIRNMLPSQ
jgi:uncharacterized protein (TIGR02246 family)